MVAPALLEKDGSFRTPSPIPTCLEDALSPHALHASIPLGFWMLVLQSLLTGSKHLSWSSGSLSGCRALGFLWGGCSVGHTVVANMGLMGVLGMYVLSWETLRCWKWRHWELWASCLIAFLMGTIKTNALEKECLI